MAASSGRRSPATPKTNLTKKDIKADKGAITDGSRSSLSIYVAKEESVQDDNNHSSTVGLNQHQDVSDEIQTRSQGAGSFHNGEGENNHDDDDDGNVEEINFDWGDIGSSSSDESSEDGDDSDSCYQPHDSEQANIHINDEQRTNILSQHSLSSQSYVDLNKFDGQNNVEIDNGTDDANSRWGSKKKKSCIFLDDDDDFVLQRRFSSNQMRRTTICEDENESDLEYVTTSQYDTCKDPYSSETQQQSKTNLSSSPLLSPRKNDSEIDEITTFQHDKYLDQPISETRQSQTHLSSPVLSPRQDDSPLLSPTRDTDDMSSYGYDATRTATNPKSIHGDTNNLLSPKALYFSSKEYTKSKTSEGRKPSPSSVPRSSRSGTGNVRKGLRTSPFPRHSFSRVFHNFNSPPAGQPNEELIESSDSESGGEVELDDLVVMPKEKSVTSWNKSEVICLDSDEDNDDKNNGASGVSIRSSYPRREDDAHDADLQRAIRTSLMPEWRPGNAISSHATTTTRLLPSRKRTRTSSLRSSESMSNIRLSSAARSSLRRVSSDAPTSLAVAGGTNRRDLTGGSGLGLGGFQVRSQYQAVGENSEGYHQHMPPPPAPQTNAWPSSKSSSTTKSNRAGTTARGRKRKTTKKKSTAKKGRGRKRNYYRKKGNKNNYSRSSSTGGAWSSNDRGISSYSGGNGSSGQYMDVGSIDPNLGNAGGATISFD